MRLYRKSRHNLIACFMISAAFRRARQKGLRCLTSADIFFPQCGHAIWGIP